MRIFSFPITFHFLTPSGFSGRKELEAFGGSFLNHHPLSFRTALAVRNLLIPKPARALALALNPLALLPGTPVPGFLILPLPGLVHRRTRLIALRSSLGSPLALPSRLGQQPTTHDQRRFPYCTISEIVPAPTVCPPSRIAKRKPFSIATGVISSITNCTLSPGITISVPDGNSATPVTSVVRR